MTDVFEQVKGKLVYAEDILDLFYAASVGQDKAFVEIVEDVVENTPEVDMTEVVRCKECKYWRDWQMAVASHGFGSNMGECHCDQWDNESFYYLTKDIDFCSYGEIEE